MMLNVYEGNLVMIKNVTKTALVGLLLASAASLSSVEAMIENDENNGSLSTKRIDTLFTQKDVEDAYNRLNDQFNHSDFNKLVNATIQNENYYPFLDAYANKYSYNPEVLYGRALVNCYSKNYSLSLDDLTQLSTRKFCPPHPLNAKINSNSNYNPRYYHNRFMFELFNNIIENGNNDDKKRAFVIRYDYLNNLNYANGEEEQKQQYYNYALELLKFFRNTPISEYKIAHRFGEARIKILNYLITKEKYEGLSRIKLYNKFITNQTGLSFDELLNDHMSGGDNTNHRGYINLLLEMAENGNDEAVKIIADRLLPESPLVKNYFSTYENAFTWFLFMNDDENGVKERVRALLNSHSYHPLYRFFGFCTKILKDGSFGESEMNEYPPYTFLHAEYLRKEVVDHIKSTYDIDQMCSTFKNNIIRNNISVILNDDEVNNEVYEYLYKEIDEGRTKDDSGRALIQKLKETEKRIEIIANPPENQHLNPDVQQLRTVLALLNNDQLAVLFEKTGDVFFNSLGFTSGFLEKFLK